MFVMVDVVFIIAIIDVVIVIVIILITIILIVVGGAVIIIFRLLICPSVSWFLCHPPLPAGNAQRQCYLGLHGGVWGVPDLARCTTKAMTELLDTVIMHRFSFAGLPLVSSSGFVWLRSQYYSRRKVWRNWTRTSIGCKINQSIIDHCGIKKKISPILFLVIVDVSSVGPSWGLVYTIMRLSMRFLLRFRVQNAPWPNLHEHFFAKHCLDWKEHYYIFSWGLSSVQFTLTWRGFVAVLHDDKPGGLGWGGYCVQNCIKTA